MNNILIVDRRRWARGERSCMYNSHTEKCCVLGFALNQLCNIQEIELYSRSYPHAISPSKLLNSSERIAYDILCNIGPDLARINDDDEISETDRERLLTTLFSKSMNISLVFKN